MSMEKVYCEKCNKKVEYQVISEIKKEYKNVEVNVKQNIGICSQCNERLYVMELEEANLDRLYEKYRELSDIVSPKDIIEFRKKYNISQNELVSILDWGKMTINRYERGSLPSKSHSDILKLIINNESYFREKVENSYKAGRINKKTYTEILTCTDNNLSNNKEVKISNFIKDKLSYEPSIYSGFKRFDLYKKV